MTAAHHRSRAVGGVLAWHPINAFGLQLLIFSVPFNEHEVKVITLFSLCIHGVPVIIASIRTRQCISVGLGVLGELILGRANVQDLKEPTGGKCIGTLWSSIWTVNSYSQTNQHRKLRSLELEQQLELVRQPKGQTHCN